MKAFEKWFRTFIDEKNPPVQHYTEFDGLNIHMFDNYDVVEWVIDHMSPEDQEKFKAKVVELDFKNGDINHFLGHMGKAFVIEVGKEQLEKGADGNE